MQEIHVYYYYGRMEEKKQFFSFSFFSVRSLIQVMVIVIIIIIGVILVINDGDHLSNIDRNDIDQTKQEKKIEKTMNIGWTQTLPLTEKWSIYIARKQQPKYKNNSRQTNIAYTSHHITWYTQNFIKMADRNLGLTRYKMDGWIDRFKHANFASLVAFYNRIFHFFIISFYFKF